METIKIPENTKPVLYTECWCNSPYHSLRWHICEDGLSFEVYLKPYNSFWKRIKNALRYIFKNEYTHCGYDEFEIKLEDIKKLESLCQQIRK